MQIWEIRFLRSTLQFYRQSFMTLVAIVIVTLNGDVWWSLCCCDETVSTEGSPEIHR